MISSIQGWLLKSQWTLLGPVESVKKCSQFRYTVETFNYNGEKHHFRVVHTDGARNSHIISGEGRGRPGYEASS